MCLLHRCTPPDRTLEVETGGKRRGIFPDLTLFEQQ
jgi:hypothetical protein